MGLVTETLALPTASLTSPNQTRYRVAGSEAEQFKAGLMIGKHLVCKASQSLTSWKFCVTPYLGVVVAFLNERGAQCARAP